MNCLHGFRPHPPFSVELSGLPEVGDTEASCRVERVGESGKRNGFDGYPFQSFSFLLPTEISKNKKIRTDLPVSTARPDREDSETGRKTNNTAMAGGRILGSLGCDVLYGAQCHAQV